MRAGSRGARIDEQAADWALPDDAVYGILFDTNKWRDFADAINDRANEVAHVFIVTDSDATYQQILNELPSAVGSTQLYADYLKTFEINTKGRV